MSRKDKLDAVAASREKRNIGPVLDISLGAAWDATVFPDRLLRYLLQSTIDQLLENPDEMSRFFSHFFDSTISADERDQFINRFKIAPPKAQLGYMRAGAELPHWGIILADEQEEDNLLGDYAGQDDVDPIEYQAALFNAVYTVFIYAEHPDVCSYQYQLAKSIVFGGKKWLLSKGIQEVQLSGGELNPDEGFFPDAVYVRALRVRMKSTTSVPRVLLVKKPSLGSIFADDVVVDGRQGGVHTTFDLEE